MLTYKTKFKFIVYSLTKIFSNMSVLNSIQDIMGLTIPLVDLTLYAISGKCKCGIIYRQIYEMCLKGRDFTSTRVEKIVANKKLMVCLCTV